MQFRCFSDGYMYVWTVNTVSEASKSKNASQIIYHCESTYFKVLAI